MRHYRVYQKWDTIYMRHYRNEILLKITNKTDCFFNVVCGEPTDFFKIGRLETPEHFLRGDSVKEVLYI